MLPSSSSFSSSFSHVPLPSHRSLRVLLIIILLCPTLLFIAQSIFTAHSTRIRGECNAELDAQSRIANDRLGSVLADLRKQVTRESENIRGTARLMREMSRLGRERDEALRDARDARAELVRKESEWEAYKTTQQQEDAAEESRIANEAAVADAAAAAPAPLLPDDAPLPKSGGVEVRPLAHLAQTQQQAASKVAAAGEEDVFTVASSSTASSAASSSTATAVPVTPPNPAQDLAALQALAKVIAESPDSPVVHSPAGLTPASPANPAAVPHPTVVPPSALHPAHPAPTVFDPLPHASTGSASVADESESDPELSQAEANIRALEASEVIAERKAISPEAHPDSDALRRARERVEERERQRRLKLARAKAAAAALTAPPQAASVAAPAATPHGV